MNGDEGNGRAGAPAGRRGKVRLAIWGSVVVLLCFALARAWPHNGNWLVVLLFFGCIGLARALFMVSRPPEKRVPFFASFFAALLLTAVLGAWTSAMSDARFERALAPWVAQLHAQAQVPCPPEGRPVLEEALRNYLGEHRIGRAMLYHDGQRFVLSFPAGSLDIDGSTQWYDSASQRWQRFHNDLVEPRKAFEALVKPMTPCQLILRSQ